MVSRATGLARDAALSRVFGLSPLMDAFWFAFMIPNLFRRLFGEGALSAAFLPQYAQLHRSDPAVARQLASLTIGAMMAALGVLALLGEIVLLAVSASADHSNIAVWLTMIMLPYMPMVCIVAILGAMLQVHGRFGPTAAAPIVLNLCIVAAAVGFGWVDAGPTTSNRDVTHIGVVAASVLAAGLLQVVWSLLALRGETWWTGILHGNRAAAPAFRRMLGQAWPMFIGLGVLQVNVFLDDLIASYPTTIGPTIFGVQFPLETGALASLSFAQRLYEFPLGVFGIAVATAIFPALARVADHADAFADILRRGLRLVVYIGLPASAGLILVREPLTAAVYKGGDFTGDDVQRVAFVLMGYAPAIWAYSMTHTLTRAFYARGDSMTPVKVAVAMVALNLTLNLTLIWTPLKEAGLAWSTAICAIVQVMILLRLTRRYASHVVDRTVAMSWVKTALATLVMSAVVWTTAQLLPERAMTWSWSIVELSVIVGVGATVMAVASLAMRMPELSWALGRTR